MKRTNRIIIKCITVMVLLAVAAGCGTKETAPQPAFNKSAARDVIQGNTWYMKGCYHKALESFHKAYEKFTALDDQDGVARTLNNLGTLYRAEKDYESAVAFFDEAIRLFKRSGDARNLVQSLSNKAAVLTDRGELDNAATLLDEAESEARKNAVVLPTLKSNRALILIRQKKTEEAKHLLTEAKALTSPSKPFEFTTIAFAMGMLHEETGDLDTASHWYTQALETDRSAGFSRNLASDLSALGRVLMAQGKYDEALDILYRCFNIQTLLDDPKGTEETSAQLKSCLTALGDRKPDIRVKEHFLKRWSGGETKAGVCK